MKIIFPTINRLSRAVAFALATTCLCAAAAAQNVTISAEFSPPQLSTGQYGFYIINVNGSTSGPDGTVPAVPDLAMQYYGPEQSVSLVNNVVTMSIKLRFRAKADKAGTYTVPQFQVQIDGKKYTVPAATLEVTQGAPASANAPGKGQIAALAAVTPHTDLYVGEKFPLDLVLSWREGVQADVTGQVVQDNDAFDHVRIYDRPEQSVITRNNLRYIGITWRFAVTALKAGEQKLSFSIPMQVAVPGSGLPINDPMIEQIFSRGLPNVFAQAEAVTVQSPALDLKVQPLPEDGRPANFTGGIGNFSVEGQNLSTADLQVGVPVTLRVTVAGKGNFDLLHAPTLDLGAAWRAYTPKESFEPSDRDGYRGVKTFEYVLMPMSDNVTLLNMPDFNYFNPDTKAYVEIPLPPIPVKIKPAPPGQALPPLPAVSSAPPANAKPELVGLHFEAGTWLPPQPRPIFISPYFWAAQAIPAFVLGALMITRSRRLRLENDPVYARKLRARREAQAALARARAAAAAGNAPEFYAMAQRALQEAASHDRGEAAEALTWRDFDAHLSGRKTPSEIREQTREIFEAGDALRFGGFAPDQAALRAAVDRLDGLVQQLLKHS